MKMHTGIRVITLIAPLTLLALAAAGCQPADEEPAIDAGEPTQGVLDEPVEPTDETAARAEDAVTATLTEWNIALESDTVPPGPTTFRVVNRGDVVHAFEVEGNGMEWVTDRLDPGQETTLETDLQAGTYEVYCPVVGERGDHSAMGMTTTLVVEGM